MKKNILFILFTLLTFLSFPQAVQKELGNLASPTVNIEFTTPKIFKMNEEIYIDVKIQNMDEKSYYSQIAQDKRYSFDFELLSLQNQKQQHSAEYNNFFNRVQPVFHSMIRLDENEGYSYRLRLNDYFDLDITGQYILRCIYYPSLRLSRTSGKSNDIRVNSNDITLNIRPASPNGRFIQESIAVEQEKRLEMEKKSPDEVVKYMLNARINGEWEKFFLYIDLDKLVRSDIVRGKSYIKSDNDKQQEIIEEYKAQLKKDRINEISYLPYKFDIIKTEYSEGSGKVDALVQFKELDYIDKKYYTYFLKKQDDKWRITSYTVSNTSSR